MKNAVLWFMQGLEQNIFQQLVTLVKNNTSRNHDDGHESSTIKREFIMFIFFFLLTSIFFQQNFWLGEDMRCESTSERVSKGRDPHHNSTLHNLSTILAINSRALLSERRRKELNEFSVENNLLNVAGGGKKINWIFQWTTTKKNFFCNVANLAESLFMFRILKSRS